MSDPITFIDRCLAGLATTDEIDDAVRQWHTGDSTLPLWRFLGMTEDEYGLWVEKSSSLRYIVAAHRQGRGVQDILASAEQFAVAARADNPAEAAKLVRWLELTGRLR